MKRRGATFVEVVLAMGAGFLFLGILFQAFQTFVRRGAKGTLEGQRVRESSLAIETLRRILRSAVEITPIPDGFEVKVLVGTPEDPRYEIWQVTRVEGQLVLVEVKSGRRRVFSISEPVSGEKILAELDPGRFVAVQFLPPWEGIPSPLRVVPAKGMREASGLSETVLEVPLSTGGSLQVYRDPEGRSRWVVPQEAPNVPPLEAREEAQGSTEVYLPPGAPPPAAPEEADQLWPPDRLGPDPVSVSQAWGTVDGPLEAMPARVRALGKTLLEAVDPARGSPAMAQGLKDWALQAPRRVDPAAWAGLIDDLVRAGQGEDLEASARVAAEIEGRIEAAGQDLTEVANQLREELGLPPFSVEPEAAEVRQAPQYPPDWEGPGGGAPSTQEPPPDPPGETPEDPADPASDPGIGPGSLASAITNLSLSETRIVDLYRRTSRYFLDKLLELTESTKKVSGAREQVRFSTKAQDRLEPYRGRLQTREGALAVQAELEQKLAEMEANEDDYDTDDFGALRRMLVGVQAGLDQQGDIAEATFDTLDEIRKEREADFEEKLHREQNQMPQVESSMDYFLDAARAWAEKDPEPSPKALAIQERLEYIEERLPLWSKDQNDRTGHGVALGYARELIEILAEEP